MIQLLMSIPLSAKIAIILCIILSCCSCCSSSSTLLADRSCKSDGILIKIKRFDNLYGLITCIPCLLPIKLLAYVVCAVTG